MPLIAQGTYGCVYNPPLKCADGKPAPKGTISKLLSSQNYKKEFKEYNLIQKIDPQHLYHISPELKCEPDSNDLNANVGKDCKIYKSTNKYGLLFYKYGGVDLNKFITENLNAYLNAGKGPAIQRDLFFVNAHKLFKAIDLFVKNEFIHNDIKSLNIVFNADTYEFYYIDFGLSKKFKDFNCIIHWSYPPENAFIELGPYSGNAGVFPAYKNFKILINNKNFEKGVKSACKIVVDATNISFMINKLNVADRNPNDLANTLFNSLLEAHKQNLTDSDLKQKIMASSDTYALGFTMNQMLNGFYDAGIIPDNMYSDFHELFKSMFDFNFLKRLSNTEEIMTRYEELLIKHGMTVTAQKRFNNHTMFDAVVNNVVDPILYKSPPKVKVASVKAKSKSKSKSKTKVKKCPKGTVRNKKTGNCEPKTK